MLFVRKQSRRDAGAWFTVVLLVVLLGQYSTVLMWTLQLENDTHHHDRHRHGSAAASHAMEPKHDLDTRSQLDRRRVLVGDPIVGPLFQTLLGAQDLHTAQSPSHVMRALRDQHGVVHSSEYAVVPNILAADADADPEPNPQQSPLLTVCTHASRSNFKAVRHQATAFQHQGPVSLAVFEDRDLAIALASISRLAQCYRSLK